MARIKVTLTRVQILDDKDDDGSGEVHINFRIGDARSPEKAVCARVPNAGSLLVSDEEGYNILNFEIGLFDAELPPNASLLVEARAVEDDVISKDYFSRYTRRFEGDPAAWVGEHGPREDKPGPCLEAMNDWRIWYRIEAAR